MSDPRQISVYCPFCQKHTAVLPAGPKHTVVDRGAVVETWWIAVCHACGKHMLVGEMQRGRYIYPSPLPSPTDERIDPGARRALVEAKICFTAGAINASATMARRAIQAAVVQKGATKSRLMDQIDELAATGAITKDLASWAHEVRYAGNDGAHPSDEVSNDDAEDILELAEQFLQVLYVAPAIAAERRQQRAAKKAP
jgi:hypothetical protein